jgi:2-polyprenyl-3-methyl-5-hydroxy-6-metoxy-1,4-benzoquinol methylase
LPSKARFLVRTLRHRLNRQPCTCPYCDSASSLVRIRRKKLVLNIMRCEACRLVFRWPMDTPEEIEDYYQHEYTPEYPQVQLPSDAELESLMRGGFSGTALDMAEKIRVLKALRPAGRLLDFGSSWGYGTWQLAQSGYEATGFEISRPRAEYARTKLGMRAIDRFDELKSLPAGSFDVVFTNHVVEHLPNVREVFEVMGRLLAHGGLVFHILPNFLGRAAMAGQWIMWIGEEHPLAPNMEFFRATLPSHGFVDVRFGSSPFNDELIESLNGSAADARTDGDELLVLAWRQREQLLSPL